VNRYRISYRYIKRGHWVYSTRDVVLGSVEEVLEKFDVIVVLPQAQIIHIWQFVWDHTEDG
jgi:hypothetical protein